MEVVVVVDRVGGVEVWREGEGGRTGARVPESTRERPGAGRGSELFGRGGDVGLASLLSLAVGEERSGLGGCVFVLAPSLPGACQFCFANAGEKKRIKIRTVYGPYPEPTSPLATLFAVRKLRGGL